MTDQEFIKSSQESGKKYGYPQCCIDAFCKDTSTALKFKAKQIARRKITLSSLVTKTPERTIDFPNDWSYQ